MSTQIVGPRKGKSKLGPDWAGTDTDEEKERDAVPDGTDYVPVSKAQTGFDRGEESEGAGVAAMLKKLKAKGAEKGMEAREEEREEEGDEGEDEGKEEKRELGMEKSFFNYIEDSSTLSEGVNQSAFLREMVKSIGYSFAKLEDNLGYVFANVHNDYVDFAKSMDGTFEDLGKSLGIISETSTSVEGFSAEPNVTPSNVTPLRKGGFGDGQPSKGDVLGVLMKGFEEGLVSPQDVIKFETTGVLSDSVQKSLGL